MHGFDAVLDGLRQRTRWRSPSGWVRVERLDDYRLTLRGPREEVLKACADARQSGWRMLPGYRPDRDGSPEALELMLLHATPAARRRPAAARLLLPA